VQLRLDLQSDRDFGSETAFHTLMCRPHFPMQGQPDEVQIVMLRL
jgi:hypothetical protein